MTAVPVITATLAIFLFIIKEVLEKIKQINQNKERKTFLEIEIQKNVEVLDEVIELLKVLRTSDLENNESKLDNIKASDLLKKMEFQSIHNLLKIKKYSISTSVYDELYLKNPFDVIENTKHCIILNQTKKVISQIDALSDESLSGLDKYFLLKGILINSLLISDEYKLKIRS
ncbi:alpha/beta interferon family protein [Exiguobacterium sp. s131]|uniref:alpha/beta interferon family protein n=1 Tax=Exiguobacterium sp. s131 TaxID=2751278 RepID=UPI001BE85BA9|nr:alpha/beta interferon family protein [Exiguobacterium sp. s131]